MVPHLGWRLALISSQESRNPEMALSSDSGMAEVPKMEGMADVTSHRFSWGKSRFCGLATASAFLPSPRPGLTAIFPSFSPILVLLAVWWGRVGKVARSHPEWERGNNKVPWESHFCI